MDLKTKMENAVKRRRKEAAVRKGGEGRDVTGCIARYCPVCRPGKYDKRLSPLGSRWQGQFELNW